MSQPHKNRMREIGQFVVPREGTPEYADLMSDIEEHRKRNPEINKVVKRMYQKAVALLQLQMLNGAGLPLDLMIREYSKEYNSRSLNGHLRDMPSSFNVMEAFTQFLPPCATFRVLQERDYLLSFIDFLDFVTSDEADNSLQSVQELMTEGEIYSFNGLHDPSDLTFTCDNDKRTFGIAGISMVRHGNEISTLMIAGEVCDLVEKTQKIEESFLKMTHLPHKQHIIPDVHLKIEAVPLVPGRNLWKTLVMSRLDLRSMSIEARYVAQDCGRSFWSHTDELSTYLNESGEFFSSQCKTMAEESFEKLNEFQSLFEFTKTCLYLPMYLRATEELVGIERHPTQYKSLRGKLQHRKLEKLTPTSEQIAFRDVSFIAPTGQRGPTNKAFFAPDFRCESRGYWKPLPINVVGEDKYGQRIHGRTWVQQTLSWIENHEDAQPIRTTSSARSIRGRNPGIIYVMRSAAHEKDIFKIGLTTRFSEKRAEELTRTTGSPDHFLVVDEWDVADCELAEKLVHERLAHFRINPKREFFKATYSKIFEAINAVLKDLESRDPDQR